MSTFTHQGVVYFVACGDYVKIGYCSGNLDTRMRQMFRTRLIVPADLDKREPLRVIHTIPGCIIRDERRIHRLFAAYHEAGEWYRLGLPFLRHLAGLEYVPDRQIKLRERRARAALKRERLRQVAA